jgi:hypothetical protein
VPPVELGCLNALRQSLLRHGFADHGGRILVAAIGQLFPHLGIPGADGDERSACFVIDQLATDVTQATLDGHPGTLGGATDAIPHMPSPPDSPLFDFLLFVHDWSRTLR